MIHNPDQIDGLIAFGAVAAIMIVANICLFKIFKAADAVVFALSLTGFWYVEEYTCKVIYRKINGKKEICYRIRRNRKYPDYLPGQGISFKGGHNLPHTITWE
jgi:hypothetical protein